MWNSVTNNNERMQVISVHQNNSDPSHTSEDNENPVAARKPARSSCEYTQKQDEFRLAEYVQSEESEYMFVLYYWLSPRFSLIGYLRRLSQGCTGLYHVTCT